MRDIAWVEEWQGHSVSTRKKIRMPQNYNPWTSDLNAKLVKVPRSLRSYDVLDCAYYAGVMQQFNNPAEREDVLKHRRALDWFVDANTGVQYEPWGPMLPTILTSSTLYSFRLDCVLSAEACPLGA